MIITIIIVAIIIIYAMSVYNTLVSKRNRIKEALAAIDVYLQNRFDTLTKIAETVVAYATHEKETLNELTRLRQNIENLPLSTDKITKLEEVEKGLRNISIQAEAYPELKANENYLHLQRTINEIEEKLSASRRTYNANVTGFNTYIASVPSNLFANMFKFSAFDLLEIAEEKKKDVDMGSLLRR